MRTKKKWEQFEQDCYKYLKDKYGSLNCWFESRGGSDSNAPDIVVSKNGKEIFSIEVKMPLAQSGQFVLKPDQKSGQLIYSSRNKTAENNSKDIVQVMNNHFVNFSKPTSGLIPIKLDEDLLYKWIQSHYQDKKSQFFITRGKSGYIVFPVNKLKEYFEVSAGYRIKKSGSTNPNKSDIVNLRNKLSTGFIFSKVGKYTVVTAKTKIEKYRIQCGSYFFLFREIEPEIGPNKYRVTRLSNTKNPNVIFRIKLKAGKTQDPCDLKKFIDALSK